jgi:hypothetical protein
MRRVVLFGVLLAGCHGLLPLGQRGQDQGDPDAPPESDARADAPPGTDLPRRDGPVDGPVSDKAALPDKKPPVDLKPADLKPPVDLKPAVDQPPPDQKQPDQAVPQACLADTDCVLYNTCCECQPRLKSAKPPPVCPSGCVQLICEALGLPKPTAICHQGKCILADDTVCATNLDCKKIDDCCICGAVHKSILYPKCQLYCPWNMCHYDGMTYYKPACVAGVCRLVP